MRVDTLIERAAKLRDHGAEAAFAEATAARVVGFVF
jgi:hypothetical protein